MNTFSYFTFRFSNQKGFSLIELVVVIGVIGILTAVSLASFSTYSDTRSFESGISDVVTTMQTAKSRSLSQVKPDSCVGLTFQGYRIRINIAASTYQLLVVCGGNTSLVEQKKLPSNVTFASGSTIDTTFVTGATNPSSITINGFGKSKTISVSVTGTIMVN